MIIFLFQIRNQKLKDINQFPKISRASEQKTLGVSKSQILFFFHCHSVVITKQCYGSLLCGESYNLFSIIYPFK